jgi:hypothetical protein
MGSWAPNIFKFMIDLASRVTEATGEKLIISQYSEQLS